MTLYRAQHVEVHFQILLACSCLLQFWQHIAWYVRVRRELDWCGDEDGTCHRVSDKGMAGSCLLVSECITWHVDPAVPDVMFFEEGLGFFPSQLADSLLK